MSVIGSDLDVLRHRYQQLRQYEDNHSQLLQDLFSYSQRLESALHTETSHLQSQLADCRLDLDDARTSRRNFQQQVQALDSKVQQLTSENDEQRNRHPYVAVLIDGDGLLFQDSFINDGLEGGKRAAHALRAAIIGQCGDLASKMEIVVKICANQSGLATAMRQSGSIASENQFKQFTLGFTQAKASFDFIDVGYGKERADSKIREDARWHLHNVNCKMVLLGISHDSGYAPFLDELSSDYNTRHRLRIVEGFPTVRELIATNIEIVNFNDTVFRADKLVADRVPNAAPSAPPVTNGAGRKSPPSSDSRNGVTKTNGVVPVSAINDTAKAKVMSPTKSPAKSPSNSYASATTTTQSSTAPAPTLSFPQATTKNLQVKAAKAAAAAAALLEKNNPMWSPGERGLDPPATYNPVHVDSIKKRKDRNKFCNNYVINGHCPNDYCEYNHKLKATVDEKKALTFLMRQTPCTYGQDCDYDECIYGHNCPSVRDGQCMQPFCRFPSSLHPPKTKFKQPFLGDE